jgi:hypothetical protein
VLTWRTDLLGLSTFYLDGNSVQTAVWAISRAGQH